MPSIVCGAIVAGRARAVEPQIDTAPRPFGALPNRRGLRRGPLGGHWS